MSDCHQVFSVQKDDMRMNGRSGLSTQLHAEQSGDVTLRCHRQQIQRHICICCQEEPIGILQGAQKQVSGFA